MIRLYQFYLESIQNKDPRIVIITNKYNRGFVYNRIYGTIQSKGEYITSINKQVDLWHAVIFEKT